MEEDNFRDDNGRLMPGHKGLKPKGANNRLQSEIKDKITDFLNGKLENLEEIYSDVSSKDKLRFIGELLAYVLPKSKEIKIAKEKEEGEVDLSQLTDEDLHTLENIHRKAQGLPPKENLSVQELYEKAKKENPHLYTQL